MFCISRSFNRYLCLPNAQFKKWINQLIFRLHSLRFSNQLPSFFASVPGAAFWGLQRLLRKLVFLLFVLCHVWFGTNQLDVTHAFILLSLGITISVPLYSRSHYLPCIDITSFTEYKATSSHNDNTAFILVSDAFITTNWPIDDDLLFLNFFTS